MKEDTYNLEIPQQKLDQIAIDQKSLRNQHINDQTEDSTIFEKTMWERISDEHPKKLQIGDKLKFGRIWCKLIEQKVRGKIISLHNIKCRERKAFLLD